MVPMSMTNNKPLTERLLSLYDMDNGFADC